MTQYYIEITYKWNQNDKKVHLIWIWDKNHFNGINIVFLSNSSALPYTSE